MNLYSDRSPEKRVRRIRPRCLHWLGAAAALVCWLALGAAVAAADSYEPNDTYRTSFGPIRGGIPHFGSLDTVNDVDWYRFYTRGFAQIVVTATNTSSCGGEVCDFINVELRDAYGRQVGSGFPLAMNLANGVSGVLRHTAPRRARYFVVVSTPGVWDAPMPYSVQIDPAGAFTPIPPPYCYRSHYVRVVRTTYFHGRRIVHIYHYYSRFLHTVCIPQRF